MQMARTPGSHFSNFIREMQKAPMALFGNVKVAPPRHQCLQRWARLVTRISAISGVPDHVTGVSSASNAQMVTFCFFVFFYLYARYVCSETSSCMTCSKLIFEFAVKFDHGEELQK